MGESPAWSAMQLLDATLEKNDWRRAYSVASKNRLGLRVCEKDSIRMHRSVSLPRLQRGPPRRQRPKRPIPIEQRQSRTAWDSVSPSPDARKDSDTFDEGDFGTAVGDAIDPSELADATKELAQVSEASPSESEAGQAAIGRRKSTEDKLPRTISGRKKRDRVKLTEKKEGEDDQGPPVPL